MSRSEDMIFFMDYPQKLYYNQWRNVSFNRLVCIYFAYWRGQMYVVEKVQLIERTPTNMFISYYPKTIQFEDVYLQLSKDRSI